MNQEIYDVESEADVDFPAQFIDKHNAEIEMEADLGRRNFLKISGLAGGGLVLALFFGSARNVRAQTVSADSLATGDFKPNGFVQITASGQIIIYAKNPEIGQGVKTSLPMIVAEELDVAWEQVTVEQSAIDRAVFGPQAAGGSMSTPRNWDPLRQAGAVARAMLVSAAAARWSVAAGGLRTEAGFVVNDSTGEKIAYADLAEAAAQLPVPDAKSVSLKKRSDYKILGKFVGGVDNHAIVTGKPLFGIDTQVPGMVYAAYVKNPRFGGGVISANLDEVKALPGVLDAFLIEGNKVYNQLVPGVAVIAESTFTLSRAQRALKVDWDNGAASSESWESYVADTSKFDREPDAVLANQGDFDAALSAAEQVVKSSYVYPYLSHATLEPHNCAASYTDGKLTIWAPSQTPQGIAGQVSKITGVPEAQIEVIQKRIGGGFGRRLDNDYVCEVAVIAHRIGKPVKLTHSRESDMAHDFYRVGGFHKMTGSLDAQGNWTGFLDHTVLFTRPENPEKPVRGGGVGARSVQLPGIQNLRLQATYQQSQIPTGWWRAPGSCSLAWVFQSFAHEMAVAAGKDHRDFLIGLFGERRYIGRKGRGLNTGRAIDVIQAVTEQAGWGSEMPEGRGRGLSFYFSHRGYFAEVAEVTVSSDKKVHIDRVYVAGDVGMLLNKSGGENQVEGSIVDGISTLAAQEIDFENGAVKNSNFHDYPLLRMPATPEIKIEWLTTENTPTGLGEPAFPPLAAAVTNAIFDATGERIYRMPISHHGFQIV